VVIGTGFLKGNVSAMVGQLYAPDDVRRDAGYSIYYMGVNLGGFLGPLVCGWLAQQPSFKSWLASLGLRPELAWHFGFGAAAVGMFFGLIQYQLGRNRLSPDADRPLAVAGPEDARVARRQASIWVGAAAGAALLLYLLSRTGILPVTPGGVATGIDLFLALLTIGFFTWLLRSGQWTKDERRRLIVILVLFLGSCAFWAGFEQAASTLNLFAQRSTANTLFGWAYPPSWLQSVNSFFIIVFAPVMGAVWLWLGARDPSRPTKFTLGLVLLSASYALMIVASLAAGAGGRVSPMWLVACYFLQTIGELSLSPVGMSAMSTLAPQRVSGLMMGVWFLSLAIGNKVAGRMGGLYESMSLPTLFGVNTLFVLIFAVGMALLIRPMQRLLNR
jgi:POT family proton-dependent oligopeptide transporter